jgi:hypothetical protein
MKTTFLSLLFSLPLVGSVYAGSSPLLLTADSTHVLLAAKAVSSDDGLRSDPGAIGEFFATSTRAYNPIIQADLPAAWESATIWVRQRGGPFQLKGNGGATELQWSWDMPTTWTWVSYGTHDRAALTAKFLIIRSDQLAPDAGIDAVVLLRDEGLVPAPAELDLLAKQAATQAAK